MTRKGVDTQDFRKTSTPEASWAAETGRKEQEGWRLEPEGETVTPKDRILWTEAEGVL